MPQTRQILIVDDDADLRQALTEQLALHAEFKVSEAGDAAAARLAMQSAAPDLIIMLTARDSDADTVIGLESGANDYVAKPFRFAVLLARIRVQLRQHDASEDAEFQIGPYVFRPATKNLVDAKGAKLRLTEKEAAILRFLHRAQRQAVPRETLLRDVWGYNANVTTHTLETHIYRLRQKIEDDPTEARLLVTDGGGYKLLS